MGPACSPGMSKPESLFLHFDGMVAEPLSGGNQVITAHRLSLGSPGVALVPDFRRGGYSSLEWGIK